MNALEDLDAAKREFGHPHGNFDSSRQYGDFSMGMSYCIVMINEE